MRSILFFLLFPLFLTAQNFAGNWQGTYNNDVITLQLASGDGKNWNGSMHDSQQQYTVSATSNGNELTGTAKEKSLGLTFQLKAVIKQGVLHLDLSVLGVAMPTVLLQRTGGTDAGKTKPTVANATAMPALPANARHDPQLVGTWKREENYQSGYGRDGGYASNAYMAFNADGTMTDLGSTTVVGGNNFSGRSQSGGAGVVPGVKWYSDNKMLFLVATEGGKTQTVKLGRYHIEQGAMLITTDNGQKALFYKQ
jgi:hypothetical protein